MSRIGECGKSSSSRDDCGRVSNAERIVGVVTSKTISDGSWRWTWGLFSPSRNPCQQGEKEECYDVFKAPTLASPLRHAGRLSKAASVSYGLTLLVVPTVSIGIDGWRG